MDSRHRILPARVAAIIGLLLFSVLSVGLCQADQLVDDQEIINQKGAQWVARENQISRLSPADRKKLLGTIIDPLLEAQKQSSPHLFRAFGDEPLPGKLDYRNINGQNFVTPVRDQGGCGSCWAFATTGALEAAVLRAYNRPGENVDLAEQVLVSCSSAGDCGGGSPNTASKFLKNTGIPLESCYPYKAANGDCLNACGDRTDTSFRIPDYVHIDKSVAALKAALVTYGPISTAYYVCGDFYKYKSGIYIHGSGDPEGGHAVLLVGYDDDDQSFIVKNSWGDWWGEDGYFRIHYSMVNDEDVQFGVASFAYTGAMDPTKTNRPPHAQAGADNDVQEGDRVTLNGNNSTDQDGNIVSYQWTQTGGPDVVLIDEETATAEFTAPGTDSPDGITLRFRLTVIDDAGDSDDDSVTVRVLRNNQRPTAAANASSPVTEGETVTLNGSNSTDPEQGVLTYLWEQQSGPAVELSDASAATCTFEAPDTDDPDGVTLVFRLTVTDDGNMPHDTDVLVNVRWINQPPTASAGDDLIGSEGGQIVLDASGSADPESHPLTYQWRQLTGETVTLSEPGAAVTSFTAPAATATDGYAMRFRLEVQDNGGLTAADEVIVNVSWVNDPPLAAVAAPETATAGDVITLDGTASADEDDGIVRYQWRQIEGTPVTLDAADQATAKFTAPDLGAAASVVLKFELTVTDAGGLVSTAGTEITVQASGTPPEETPEDNPADGTPPTVSPDNTDPVQSNATSGGSSSGCLIGTISGH